MTRFALRPYEDMIPGVRFRDGQLRLRPSWGATALGLYGCAFGVLFTIVGIVTSNAFAVVVGPMITVLDLPFLRCRVIAEGRTLTVVNRLRTTTLAIGDVDSVATQDFYPSWFLPFRDPMTLWPRKLAGTFLVLQDGGWLRCDALVGLPRWSTDSAEPTPIEAKADLLRRWLASEHRDPLNL